MVKLALEFRSIAGIDLIKQDRIGRWDVIVHPFFVFLKSVFGHVAGFAAVGHDAESPSSLISSIKA